MRTRTGITLAILLLLALPTATAAITEREVFQSDRGLADFGYDYSEDVEYDGGTNAVNPSFDNCYVFTASSNDFAYLGRYIPEGKRAYKLTFDINAAQEGVTGAIYAAFSTNDLVPEVGTKGNGKTTGAFSNVIKAKFSEKDGYYDAWFMIVNNGVESSLGNVVQVPGANHWERYSFIVDTTARTVSLEDGNGMVRNSAILPSAWQDQPLWSQWFVGYGYSSTFNSGMCIDDNAPSTQILDIDPQSPTITAFDYTPSVVGPLDSITVTATVTDDWQDLGAPAGTLYYQINNGGTQTQTMTRSGTTYTGQIPGQVADTQVRFWVGAKDVSDLESRTDAILVVVGSGESGSNIGGSSCDTCNTTAGGEGPGGSTTVSTGRALLYSVLIAVSGLALAILVRALTTNTVLPTLFLMLGVFGAIFYAMWATDAGGTQQLINDLPAGALIGGLAALAILVALAVLLPNRAGPGPAPGMAPSPGRAPRMPRTKKRGGQ